MKKYQTNQNEHHSIKYGVGEDCILSKMSLSQKSKEMFKIKETKKMTNPRLNSILDGRKML